MFQASPSYNLGEFLGVITSIGTSCWGEEIEAWLPWENDTIPCFDDRQSLDTFLVAIIYLATLLENLPGGNSTFQF